MDVLLQIIFNGLIAASIYMLIALGFNLAYSTTKFFNMAHGAMIFIGGYTVFFLIGTLHWNLYLACAFGVFISGAAGFILDKAVYLKLRKNKATNMALLIASLGALAVFQAAAAMFFGSQFQPLSSFIAGQKGFNIFGGIITNVQLVTFISGLSIMAVVSLVLKKTMFGKQVRAIADDEEVAKIIGINTNRVIGYVFFISSAIAGLAGIFFGLDTGIQPTMGIELLLYGIVAAIIGGVGNIYGSVLGALLIGLVENFAVWQLPSEWKAAVTYGILILFLIFRPQGILGRRK